MTLSADSAERIGLLYGAAKRNGSLMTVQEISRLLPQEVSLSEVEAAIVSVPTLSARFELKSGFLVERNRGQARDPSFTEEENRGVARKNLLRASRFVSMLHTSRFEVVAVSGSTSYGSAGFSRDADLFCVAPSGMMWISLARSLLLARAYGLLHKESVDFCFSCVMDESFAFETFSSRRDPLFARDALEARTMMGHRLYLRLLREASWISGIFPTAYDRTVGDSPTWDGGRVRTRARSPLNLFLFVVMRRYIQLKASMLNKRLKKKRRSGALFEVKCAEDHLIYESRRYKGLRAEYETLRSTMHLAAE